MTSKTSFSQSRDQEHHLVYNFPGFKMFGFLPQMTQNTQNLASGDLDWPPKPLFRYHVSKSFILVYKLSRFQKFLILTPNDLKSPGVGRPRKPLFRNHGINSFILIYNLSWFENVLVLSPDEPRWPLISLIWGQVTSTDQKITFS